MMSKKKKTVVIIVAIVLVLLISAGAALYFLWPGEDSPLKKKKKKKVIVKQYPETSDNQSTVDDLNAGGSGDYYLPTDDPVPPQYDDDYYDGIRRELYKKTQNSAVTYVPEYKVTATKWSGPKGYVIVYADGDKNSKKVAEIIQAYFEKTAGVKLKIVTDKTKEQKKEILVGDTNRYKTKLSENEYAVKVSGNKLIFEGGHYVMLNKAANWFASQKYTSGKVNALTGKTKDFAAHKSGGYEYVWGDEFSGNSLSTDNWVLANRGGTTALKEARTDSAVLKVDQDNLKLKAIRSYRQENPLAEYAVPMDVTTQKTMSFMCGYLEMCARVPFGMGAWQSLWASSTGAYNNNSKNSWGIEVDVFEGVSSIDTLIPNIHKWAGTLDAQYNSHHYANGEKAPATPYVFEDTENLINEYHIYGFKWTPKAMIMSVDGKDYMTFDLTEDFDTKGAIKEALGMGGFNQPISIILSNNLFSPDTELWGGAVTVNNTDLPFEFDIDWIRLYQIPGEGEFNVAE